jgi:hypothetical protein
MYFKLVITISLSRPYAVNDRIIGEREIFDRIMIDTANRSTLRNRPLMPLCSQQFENDLTWDRTCVYCNSDGLLRIFIARI